MSNVVLPGFSRGVETLCAARHGVYPGRMSLAEPMSAPFFERVLAPHRSLPPRGFHLLMLLLGLISLGVGIGFVAIGAWPICGFFGLDVAALYLAFRLSYRSARQREVLRLAGDDFTVERIDIYGERRLWRFQPFWLRVILEEGRGTADRLFLASHGRRLLIGHFLAPAMRREVALSLRAALAAWRAALNSAGGAR